MAGITDMHCHVLPGLDDGPQAMKDSVAILREASKQGISRMIVTPHHHPGRYVAKAPDILEAIDRVQEELDKRSIQIELIPGQECYYHSGLMDALEAGEVLTMAGSNYVLVEFDPGTLYSVIQQGVRDLVSGGYRPIIAHYERYRCLDGETDRLDELMAGGAKLQMNFDRLLSKDSIFHRNPWRRLLKQGYVDFLGSDTHGMNFRPLHVKEAVAWMKKDVDREIVQRVLKKNINKLLKDGDGQPLKSSED